MWIGSELKPLCASANEESGPLVNNAPLTVEGSDSVWGPDCPDCAASGDMPSGATQTVSPLQRLSPVLAQTLVVMGKAHDDCSSNHALPLEGLE